jgi:hypothetical protein
LATKSEPDHELPELSGDTLPEQAGVYVPPRPLASLSNHRTIDVKAIRLSAGVDPRQARTQVRLQAPLRRKKQASLLPVLVSLSLVLLGAAAWFSYSVFSRATLATEGPVIQTAAPPPAVAPEPPAPPTAVTNAPGDSAVTVRPGAAAPAPLSELGSASETSTAPEVTAPPAAPSPAPRGTAPQKSNARREKVHRDPWLE